MADLVPNKVNPATHVLMAESRQVDQNIIISEMAKKVQVPQHAHQLADVSGLTAALSGKQDKP